MSKLSDAIADTFRAHPGWMTFGAIVTLGAIFGGVAEVVRAFHNPSELNCTINSADVQTSSGFEITFGIKNETTVSIPADELQALGNAPISFTCEVK